MKNQAIKYSGILAVACFLSVSTAHAFNLGNVMNPSKWMGGKNDDDYYDDYPGGPGYGPPPGYYGGPGYGGPGGYGPPGYGGPGGYGAPGYGAPGMGAPADGPQGYGAPGVGAPGVGAPAYSAPAATSGHDAAEIARLKERIRALEQQAGGQQAQPPAYGGQQGYQGQPYGGQQGYPGSAPGAYGGQPAYQAPAAPAYGGSQDPRFRPPGLQ